MNKYGLSDKRYEHLIHKFPDSQELEEVIERWGLQACENGYDIFDFDSTGMLEIERIDEIGLYETDEEAAVAAANNGVAIIPVEELPKNFDRKYFGWIDTKENREAIERYCIGE